VNPLILHIYYAPDIWEFGKMMIWYGYSVGNEGYKAVSKSQVLPSLDVDLLMRLI
jgi:hypothetical protein